MLTSYLILGLPLDASDQQIRQRYLELVKRYTPEKEPRRFQEISEAFEQLKNVRARVRSRILGPLECKDSQQALTRLARASRPARRRAGLGELLAHLSKETPR